MSDLLTSLHPGQRVRYVGIHGRSDGPTGRVSRVLKTGVLVRWDDGNLDQVHPEDIQVVAIELPATSRADRYASADGDITAPRHR